MRANREVFGGVLLLSAILLVAWPSTSSSRTPPQTGEPVPAYHDHLPPGPLPATMAPSDFSDPVVKNAYRLAARVKKVLYKQPCYCHCDRSQGHGSLLDCYVSMHASMCDICVREALYSYEQNRKGKTPEQIRAGIIRGDWQTMNISKYRTYPAKP
ncbi:MAG TPA: CYCXC family (seleno)protein [Candidatus Acidoferrum sp.]|nr:CYCXC family (seleno)protein [Candidatus Acidoferrum sp.]